jgi:hypothetical protein
MAKTPTAELLEIHLEQPVEEWIAARAAEGWSFGRMAAEVYAKTGRYVSAQTLKNWATPEPTAVGA